MAANDPHQLTWSEVAARLDMARIYWLHTTNETGAPHASPLWAVVADPGVYVYTPRSTVKARNLARDQRVVLHLESGADVVIVRGEAEDLGHPRDSPVIVDAFGRKYDQPDERPFLPAHNPDFDALYVIHPTHATMWHLPDSQASTRRWAAAARH